MACSSRASKNADGTPLYCAVPRTTIASDRGRESCRAFHQIASAVEATSRKPARTAAPSARAIRPPRRTTTRHGYHAGLTSCGGRRGHPVASGPGALPAQGRPAGLEAGHRHPERRAGHVVQPDVVEEVHRIGVAAVLAADAELEVRPGRAAGLGADLHEPAHALAVERLERRDPEDALVEVLV